MSVIANTATSLSRSFYLKNYYKTNQKLTKASTRQEFSKSELSYEDSLALHRAARKLSSYSYSDDENQTNIHNSILAYVDTYNNTIDSASQSNSKDVERYSKRLKSLAKKHADELSSLGITVHSDGTMEASENVLKKADLKKIKNVFEKNQDLIKTTEKYASKLETKSYESYYSQITGAGSSINIQL